MRITIIGLVVAVLVLLVPLMARAIEEPSYEITSRMGEIEVRQYAGYTVAEVVVGGTAEQAGNEAFQILAGYIFGKNTSATKLAMTAPVTQTPASTKLPMTAPVTQSLTAEGYRVQFVLPKGITPETAPRPVDTRITLRWVTPTKRAVIRYSGFWSDSNYNEHLAKLEAALKTAHVAWVGEPVYSRYNPPFWPWFLRRNEIWLALE